MIRQAQNTYWIKKIHFLRYTDVNNRVTDYKNITTTAAQAANKPGLDLNREIQNGEEWQLKEEEIKKN